MKSTKWVGATAAALLISAPALAGTADPVESAKAGERAGQQAGLEQALVHKMMGHIELAAIAIDAKLKEDATRQIHTAQKLASELERNAPQLSSETRFKYGKVTYNHEASEKDYYVPILDDVFLVSDYQNTFDGWFRRKADFDETQASVVEVGLSVDLRDVKAALAAAETQLAAGHFSEARTALGEIFTHAIREETVVTDPIWAVHDNIAFAKNLIRERQFGAARFALKHAHDGLAALEKQNAGKKQSVEFERVRQEITAADAELRKEDPTLAESLEARAASWMSSARSWLAMESN